jgi:DNA-binding protein YbaB
MEDGLQALEEIEKSAHNNFSISGEGDDDDDEEVTDEDLIQAYNEAMAIDIEPESEAVAALTKGLNMPNFGSELT